MGNENGDRPILPPLRLAQLQRKADDFLKQYNPSAIIPVPIEEIADRQLDLRILPIPGLEKVHGLHAYLSHNLKNIVIDQHTYDNNENRTRFSIAHELGHVVLHDEFYRAYPVHEPVDVLDFQQNISAQDRKFMENQAHTFAAHILMPPELFCARVNDLQLGAGSLEDLTVVDVGAIVAQVAEEFCVSSASVIKHFRLHVPELYALMIDVIET